MVVPASRYARPLAFFVSPDLTKNLRGEESEGVNFLGDVLAPREIPLRGVLTSLGPVRRLLSVLIWRSWKR